MTLDTEPDLTTPWKERDKIGKAEIVRHLIEKQGMTAGSAAEILHTSRNAVIGIQKRRSISSPVEGPLAEEHKRIANHRRNLAQKHALERRRIRNSTRVKPPEPKKPRKNAPKPTAIPHLNQYAPVPDKAWQPLAGSTPKPLHEHRHNECLWPLLDHPILFCCLPAEPNHAYCPAHRALGFRPNPGKGATS